LVLGDAHLDSLVLRIIDVDAELLGGTRADVQAREPCLRAACGERCAWHLD
jgi:hypothetical protein